MTAPQFALITEGDFKRLKVNKQDEILWEAQRFHAQKGSSNKSAQARWAAISAASSAYWETAPAHKSARKATGTITATECNDWLATLPAWPLA